MPAVNDTTNPHFTYFGIFSNFLAPMFWAVAVEIADAIALNGTKPNEVTRSVIPTADV